MAGNYGIKVSKDGYDILTAGIADQIFNSSANSFKIALEGDATDTIPQFSIDPLITYGEIEVVHNLGYIPGFLVFCEFANSGKWYLPYSFDLDDSNKNVRVRADSSKLYVRFSAIVAGSYIATIRYYLFVDPGV